MTEFFKKIADSKHFTNFITIVIVLAGIAVGIDTYGGFRAKHETILHIIDQIILWIFVGEIVVKVLAEGKKPWRYFLDPWNVFDFIIVVAKSIKQSPQSLDFFTFIYLSICFFSCVFSS